MLAAATFLKAAEPQIISAKAGDEGAIVIKWESTPNAVYRIEFATELVEGATQWKTLYDDYPSHGTNTFWMDNGDYSQEPPIKRPKDDLMRFYRVVKIDTNTAPAPFVMITSPANNSILSGEVTISVIATSTLPVLRTALFVDGQEMNPSDDGTNYVINTSEWANGPHTLFAVAKAASRHAGLPGSYVIDYGRAVSSYVPVTFSNYVSQLYFSQPFFEPALGQTQTVTAAFNAYSAWTLQIVDETSTPVRTATGTGRTMSFDWDGTGDGGISLPDGIYEYLVSAVETAEPPPEPEPPQESPPAPPGGSSSASTSQETSYPTSPTEALKAGLTSYVIPTPPLPSIRRDGKWYSWEEVFGPPPLNEVQVPLRVQEAFLDSMTAESSGITMAGAMGGGAAPAAPKKRPSKPVKGKVGTIGMAYFRYVGGGTYQAPLDGSGIPGRRVQIGSTTFTSLATETKGCADNFAFRMGAGGWKVGFNKPDPSATDLKRSDLGGNNIFNQVNLGLFISHGTYGTTLDFTQAASQSFQTYVPLSGPNNPANSWLRFSELKFGTGGSSQLRWMGLVACWLMRDNNYQSMLNKGVLPIGDKLHLLCSTPTLMMVSTGIGDLWATELRRNSTIPRAWFDAGRRDYRGQTTTPDTMVFRVAGWDSTFSDTLRLYTEPDPAFDTITFTDETVWP